MNAAMDALIELLRGQEPGREMSEVEWEQLLRVAEEHGVLPWAASRMRPHAEALPAAIAEQLVQIECSEAQAAFFWREELKSVLRVFAERQIPIIPLKGPWFAERVYGSAALRPCRDLDLLVAKDDLRRAEEALAAIGFQAAAEADDYHRAWRRQTTSVELHWDVENPLAFNLHTPRALERAKMVEFDGEPCRGLVPEDELLYLCLHAARHGYDRLGLVLDLRLAFERLAIERWQPRREVADLNGLLVLGLAMARRLEPDLRDGWNPDVADAERRHIEQMANGAWMRLRTEAIGQRDWRAAHRFYVELEPTAGRRMRRHMRHARILLTRTIDRDREFAARIGMLRGWQIWLLRPVRLVAERLRRR